MKPNLVKTQNHNEKGIGLVEVILALGVAIIVITSMVSLSIFTLRSSLESRLLFAGTKYANKQMELVRAYRDSSAAWSTFRTAMGNCSAANCYMNDLVVVAGTYTYPSEGITVLFRTSLPIGGENWTNATAVRIAVTTSWSIGGNTRYANLYTDLSNWRNR